MDLMSRGREILRDGDFLFGGAGDEPRTSFIYAGICFIAQPFLWTQLYHPKVKQPYMFVCDMCVHAHACVQRYLAVSRNADLFRSTLHKVPCFGELSVQKENQQGLGPPYPYPKPGSAFGTPAVICYLRNFFIVCFKPRLAVLRAFSGFLFLTHSWWAQGGPSGGPGIKIWVSCVQGQLLRHSVIHCLLSGISRMYTCSHCVYSGPGRF